MAAPDPAPQLSKDSSCTGGGVHTCPWEVLPQQPVGVLVRAALPGAVRVAEGDRHASIDPQLRVLAQLRSLIPGQRASQLLGQGGDRARDGVAHRLSPMLASAGPFLVRTPQPWPAMRGR